MYKYVGIMALGLLCAGQALAETTWEKCNSNNGGTLVTVGEQTFCKSDSTMNWWSAYAWCEAIGGCMPSIVELCPGPITDEGACPIKGHNIWSSTINVDNSSYVWTLFASNQSTGVIRKSRHPKNSIIPETYCVKD